MKLFKTTIVILSEYDPTFTIEIDDLARDARQGESYCLSSDTVEIDSGTLEGEGVKEFFGCLPEV